MVLSPRRSSDLQRWGTEDLLLTKHFSWCYHTALRPWQAVIDIFSTGISRLVFLGSHCVCRKTHPNFQWAQK